MSIVVAMVASYAALEFASRVTYSSGRAARAWLVGGAVAMGTGIWSMHFIGMLAFRLPLRMAYEPSLTALSMLIAVVTSGFALALVSRERVSPPALLLGGLLMGAGICGMHYTGMAAMRMRPAIDYQPLIFTASVLIAVLASLAALWLAYVLRGRSDSAGGLRLRILAAVVMGVAISGMHYTGMAAARFDPSSLCTVDGYLGIDSQPLGYLSALAILVVLAMALLASSFEARLAARDAAALQSLQVAHEQLQRELEARENLQRMYAVQSEVSALILRARHRDELFEGACRIAVETGGFALAWIGVLERGEIRPQAMFGDDGGYLQDLRVAASAAQAGEMAPLIEALHDGRAHASNDMLHDPRLAPFKAQFVELGLRSYAGAPLMVAGQLCGCFCLYSGNADAFHERELALLSQAAGNLSYALESITRNDKLDYLASYDPLTRLANRRLFRERLIAQIERARRTASPLAVLLIDIQRFRQINDSIGRAGGDELLQFLAGRLAFCAGAVERLGRESGDRFMMVVGDLQSADELPPLLDTLTAQLRRQWTLRGHTVDVDVVVGGALFPQDGQDADTLLRNAEAALISARAEKRGYVLYTSQAHREFQQKRDLESRLRRALERGEFVLHYQPKLACDSGAIVGAEALLRWNDPELGPISPSRFVPLLEQSGQIVEVGSWALAAAARDWDRWRAEGLMPPKIAVNVSNVQLRRADFVEVVQRALGHRPADMHGIDLEITESMLIDDYEATVHKLGSLRGLGLSIAIDDFGTGYSSLANLANLPVTAVKIDRSFITGMTGHGEIMEVVAAIVALAHSLSLKVVAEGVDSVEQLRILRQLHCDEIQGFLFSEGLPADEFAHLLREGRHLELV